MKNGALDRQQKFSDVERRTRSAQTADICGPVAPLFSIVGKGSLNLRDHLSRYLAQVADGQEITVTDRGKAIARVVPVDRLSKMDQLIAEGVITPPSGPRTPASELPRIEVEGDLMEFIRWAQGKV